MQKKTTEKDWTPFVIVIGSMIMIILTFAVVRSENAHKPKPIPNTTDAELKQCTCQERCLIDLESEYCDKHDCEIYDINVPPCEGKTMIVRRTTRQKIDYVIPPYDYAECYTKCLKQNTTPLMP